MTDPAVCPTCREPLAADAAGGACPKCLFAAGLDTGGAAAADAVPSIEELAPKFPGLAIERLLGRGGMGVVYKARHKALDRDVALKVLPARLAADRAFAERFQREARALAKLQHPNIVGVHDFGETDGLFWLVMEYVDGVNVRQAMRAGRTAHRGPGTLPGSGGEAMRAGATAHRGPGTLPGSGGEAMRAGAAAHRGPGTLPGSGIGPREALGIVPQVCDALQYAHDHGVVHRDIKPENVLLDREGRAKVADFGLAKIAGLGAPDASLTAAGQVMGTPHYMAPEQWEAPASVDHRADIYSLGVVFYEMLTGEVPMGRFDPPSRKAEIDARIDDIVLRTLAREREARYQQAGEVKTAVTGVTAGVTAPVPDEERVARAHVQRLIDPFGLGRDMPRGELITGACLAVTGAIFWASHDADLAWVILPLAGLALMAVAVGHRVRAHAGDLPMSAVAWVLGVAVCAAVALVPGLAPPDDLRVVARVTGAAAVLAVAFGWAGRRRSLGPLRAVFAVVVCCVAGAALLAAAMAIFLASRYPALEDTGVVPASPRAEPAAPFDAVDEDGAPVAITEEDRERIGHLWRSAKSLVGGDRGEMHFALYAWHERHFDADRLARARHGRFGLPLIGPGFLPAGLAGFRLVRVEFGTRGPASWPTWGVGVATDGRRMLRFGLVRPFVGPARDGVAGQWFFAATRVELLDHARAPAGDATDAILRLVDDLRASGPFTDLAWGGRFYTPAARTRLAALAPEQLRRRADAGEEGLPLAPVAALGGKLADLSVEIVRFGASGASADVSLRDWTQDHPGHFVDCRVARGEDGRWRFTDDPVRLR